jgi:hypothetical protein
MRAVGTRISIALGCVIVAICASGIILYPDGPIHPCVEHDYCGKQGQPHTRQDFDEYNVWVKMCMWGCPVGVLVVVLLQRKRLAGTNQS